MRSRALVGVAVVSWSMALLACSGAVTPQEAAFHPVAPIVPSPGPEGAQAAPTEPPPAAPADLQIGQTQYFAYALPRGWRVGEDGAFALTLIAPDSHALTVLVGNSGLPLGTPPDQFVYQKLSAMQIQDIRLGPPRPAQPLAGFSQAVEYDVTYSSNGVPCRGVARCQVAASYDSEVLAMTAALSVESQWPGYASWLPNVAQQVAATNGGAFGMRGVMAQNLANSTAYAEAARAYRDSSQRAWQQVTDARGASEDKRNAEVRENLGGVSTYHDPYDAGRAVELPTTYAHNWLDRQGNVVGTDDPSADPNVGGAGEWRPMERATP